MLLFNVKRFRVDIDSATSSESIDDDGASPRIKKKHSNFNESSDSDSTSVNKNVQLSIHLEDDNSRTSIEIIPINETISEEINNYKIHEKKEIENITKNYLKSIDEDLIEDKKIVLNQDNSEGQFYKVLGFKVLKTTMELKHINSNLRKATFFSARLDPEPVENYSAVLQPKIIEYMQEKYGGLFPVQCTVIPWLVSKSDRDRTWIWPRDICVSSPTGSGKTLAYIIPIIQEISKLTKPKLRAIIIAPSNNLCTQIVDIISEFAFHTHITVTHLLQKSVPPVNSSENFTNVLETDILVAVPNILVSFLHRFPNVRLNTLHYLVFDEADSLVMNNKKNWIRILEKRLSPEDSDTSCSAKSLKCVTRRTQRLLFSATLTTDPEKLSFFNLFQPKIFLASENGSPKLDDNGEVILDKYIIPSTLRQLIAEVENEKFKPLVLAYVLENLKWRGVLCFTSSCKHAHALRIILESMLGSGYVGEVSRSVTSFHRFNTMRLFSRKKIRMIVTTDRMARGLDVRNINYVISYDPPKNMRSYVHRSGRSGRAGNNGTTVTILSNRQSKSFFDMKINAGKCDDISNMEIPEEYYQNNWTRLTNSVMIMKKKTKVNTDDADRQNLDIVKKIIYNFNYISEIDYIITFLYIKKFMTISMIIMKRQ